MLGITAVLLLLLGGCGRTETAAQERDTDISRELTYTGSMDLVYAEKFAVDYYEGGYALITVNQDMQYLLVPDGLEAPSDLKEGIAVLQQPVDHIYLVAVSGDGHVCFHGRAGRGPFQRSSGKRMVYRRGQGSHGSGRYPVRGGNIPRRIMNRFWRKDAAWRWKTR